MCRRPWKGDWGSDTNLTIEKPGNETPREISGQYAIQEVEKGDWRSDKNLTIEKLGKIDYVHNI